MKSQEELEASLAAANNFPLYQVPVGFKGEGYSNRTILVYAPDPEKAKELALEAYKNSCVVNGPVSLHEKTN